MKDNIFLETKNLLESYINIYDSGVVIDALKHIKATFEADLENLEKQTKFKLSLVGKDSRLETIDDVSYTVTELDRVVFMQPLAPLCEQDYESLAIALEESAKDLCKDRKIILIPFDIKLIKARAVLPE